MSQIILILLAALCVVYMAFSMRRGVPESLSATYYDLGRYGWVFQAFVALVAAMLYFVWLPVSEDGHEWMVFLSCASLLFVAAAPCFRLPLEGMVHYSSAVVCCLCAVSWQMAEGLWDVTLWFACRWCGAGSGAGGWSGRWCSVCWGIFGDRREFHGCKIPHLHT